MFDLERVDQKKIRVISSQRSTARKRLGSREMTPNQLIKAKAKKEQAKFSLTRINNQFNITNQQTAFVKNSPIKAKHIQMSNEKLTIYTNIGQEDAYSFAQSSAKPPIPSRNILYKPYSKTVL